MDSVPSNDFSWHVVTLSERWRRRGGFGEVADLFDLRDVDSVSLFSEEELEAGDGKGDPHGRGDR